MGPESCSGPAGKSLLVGLVVVGRLEIFLFPLELAPHALDPVLAPNAGLDLRKGPEARGRNRLLALHTGAVLTILETVQRRGQPVDPVHQQLARREAALTALVGLNLVDLVGEWRVVADGARQLLDSDRPAHPAEPADCRSEILFQPLANRFHCRGLLVLLPALLGPAIGATAVP